MGMRLQSFSPISILPCAMRQDLAAALVLRRSLGRCNGCAVPRRRLLTSRGEKHFLCRGAGAKERRVLLNLGRRRGTARNVSAVIDRWGAAGQASQHGTRAHLHGQHMWGDQATEPAVDLGEDHLFVCVSAHPHVEVSHQLDGVGKRERGSVCVCVHVCGCVCAWWLHDMFANVCGRVRV